MLTDSPIYVEVLEAKTKLDGAKSREFVGLLESIEGAERLSDGCYLLTYPGFKLYVYWMQCKAVSEYTLLFTSKDGVHFVKVREMPLGAEVCDAMKVSCEIRLYYHSISKGISRVIMFRSIDGESWSGGEIVYERQGFLADPSVTHYKGKYYMVVTVR